MGKGRKQSVAISAAMFLILEIAAVTMLSRGSSLQNIWLNRISHRLSTAVWGGHQRVRNYLSLEKTNTVLARQNFELLQKVRRYEDFLSYQERMAALQSLDNRGIFSYSCARIVQMTTNTQHNYFVIDKGSEDGVAVNSGVFGDKGVVGIIDAVDKHFAYGRTLMNSNMSVSARIGRNGMVAPLEWDGRLSNGARLKNISVHLEPSPGDTVWTSGLSLFFPPDIPLGVTGKSRTVNGATVETEVTLFQDFSTLKYVTVASTVHPDEINNLIK